MAKKNATNATADTATAKTAVAENSVVDKDEPKITNAKRTGARKPATLEDSEEIEVISLVPNVSYKDKRTEDMYEWDETGHIEYMTFETLKDMWRNNKGYFRNLCLKPLDERVLVKFGLTKTFAEYEFLMKESSYDATNIDKLVAAIDKIPMTTKYMVVNKIKELVSIGKISDINVIKRLGNKLNVDFISFS